MPLRSALLALLILLAGPTSAQENPLPSWQDGAARQAIVGFVEAATAEGDAGFIAPADRIAVFDNDGTLWSEQPAYFQALFIADRVRALAPEHPEWRETQPFNGVLEGDMKAVAATGEAGLMQLVAATHAGMTSKAFESEVEAWIGTAKHPRFERPYTDLVFAPMLELLDYLRANGFATWIVSGGGIDFMRPWAEEAYGIPPQQVVGSQIEVKYQVVDGAPGFLREPKVAFIDDGPGKPVGILRHIGKRPVAAFGNSDGDFEMLEYVTSGEGPRLGVLIHHTDAAREWAYDRESHVGRLARGLDEGPGRGWVIVDMAADWARIYPFEK
jgi:phosphoserine phosphatase